MSTKKHYEYLADTILNDSILSMEQKHEMFKFLCRVFLMNFGNFDMAKWVKRWTDQFQSPLDSQAESRSLESSETKPTKPG